MTVSTAAVDVPGQRSAPMALSPSRAADFMQCPLLYRFRVVDRLHEPPSPAAVRGTLVHAVLEKLYDLPASERTADAARRLLGPQWDRLREAEPGVDALFDGDAEPLAGWLESAAALVSRYFDVEDPTRLEPAGRELYLEATLPDGLTLRGYVDRLDAAPNGALRVVDYKTSRSPSEMFERKALYQMRFYGLVLWRARGVVPGMLKLVYLGDGSTVEYAPDEADLAATERNVVALWAAIQRAAVTGDWRASPGRMCDWCAHQALCPAFGGTPPVCCRWTPWPARLVPRRGTWRCRSVWTARSVHNRSHSRGGSMFVQVIRGRVTDVGSVRAALDRWVQDLSPGASGWLGTTAGVTEDGRFVALARFESQEAARRNSDRPEQGQWWAETSALFTGEASFHDSTRVDLDVPGDPDAAGFVQVIQGRSSDPDRARELMAQNPQEWAAFRPDVLASVSAEQDGGAYTMAMYFTSEEDAREGERKEMPPDLKEQMDAMDALGVGEPEFFDLKEPWLFSPR